MVIAAIKLKDICSLEGSIAGDSLLSEPPGKPKSTGVGSLSLLQEIFLTQGLNRGLLHFRQILYQMSYEGKWFSMHGNSKKEVYLLCLEHFELSQFV